MFKDKLQQQQAVPFLGDLRASLSWVSLKLLRGSLQDGPMSWELLHELGALSMESTWNSRAVLTLNPCLAAPGLCARQPPRHRVPHTGGVSSSWTQTQRTHGHWQRCPQHTGSTSQGVPEEETSSCDSPLLPHPGHHSSSPSHTTSQKGKDAAAIVPVYLYYKEATSPLAMRLSTIPQIPTNWPSGNRTDGWRMLNLYIWCHTYLHGLWRQPAGYHAFCTLS